MLNFNTDLVRHYPRDFKKIITFKHERREKMLTKEDREIDDFLRSSSQSMRVEVNFIADKFSNLPLEKQREIHNQLKSGDREQFFLAAKELVKFVQDNPVEMAKSIYKESLIPPWIIPEYAIEGKTLYIGLYFKKYLHEQVVIDKIV